MPSESYLKKAEAREGEGRLGTNVVVTGSQAMAGRTAAPWPGADGIRERQSRFNRQRSHGPISPGQKPGLFFVERGKLVSGGSGDTHNRL
jgi:hypothetical protein